MRTPKRNAEERAFEIGGASGVEAGVRNIVKAFTTRAITHKRKSTTVEQCGEYLLILENVLQFNLYFSF